ncbi:MAG: hypothetical protein KGJ84_02060 [Elusimicrobia bacterium]|nr:hypothetical protein [Elusimicrobiota bacterium]
MSWRVQDGRPGSADLVWTRSRLAAPVRRGSRDPHEREARRPILTCGQLLGRERSAGRTVPALLDPGEFLGVVEALSGHAADRRIAQFYSSPGLRLLPLPVYRFRHTAHYLHPEHTLRLAVILRLRRKYFFPLRLLRDVLATLHPAHYGFILRDGLSAEDIVKLARSAGSGLEPEDLLFRRVARLLAAADALDGRAADPQGQSGSADAFAKFTAWLGTDIGRSSLQFARARAERIASLVQG